MVFDPNGEEIAQERYTSRADAEIGHVRLAKLKLAKLKLKGEQNDTQLPTAW
jgi:hypothetical protein